MPRTTDPVATLLEKPISLDHTAMVEVDTPGLGPVLTDVWFQADYYPREDRAYVVCVFRGDTNFECSTALDEHAWQQLEATALHWGRARAMALGVEVGHDD